MAFALKLRRMNKSDIDKKVKEAAEILGITDLLQRKPKANFGRAAAACGDRPRDRPAAKSIFNG